MLCEVQLFRKRDKKKSDTALQVFLAEEGNVGAIQSGKVRKFLAHICASTNKVRDQTALHALPYVN